MVPSMYMYQAISILKSIDDLLSNFFLNYTKNTKQKNASIQNTYVMPLAAIL